MSENVAGKRIVDLPAATSINDTDVVVIDTGTETKQMTYANLCAAVAQTLGISTINNNITQLSTGKLDASKVIASTEISEAGNVMDGKTCADALAQLSSKLGTVSQTVMNGQAGENQVHSFDLAAGRQYIIACNRIGSNNISGDASFGTIATGGSNNNTSRITWVSDVANIKGIFSISGLKLTITIPSGVWIVFAITKL